MASTVPLEPLSRVGFAHEPTRAVIVRGVEKRYGDVVALDGVSLDVAEGEIFGILGPNGAGKSTLIEILEGLRVPDAGTVEVLGNDVVDNPRANLGEMGIAMQKTALPQLLRVEEVVSLFAALLDSDDVPQRVLSGVGLADARRKLVHTLSGGQLQRLAIAVATLGRPRLLFLDEPTSELDPHGRRLIWDGLLERRARDRATLVLTTHQMEEAQELCDRVAIVDAGVVLCIDTPRALIDRFCPGNRIRFTTSLGAHIPLADAQVRPSPSHLDRAHVTIATDDLNDAMARLAAARAASPFPLDELRIDSSTLEDVFLTVTER